MKTLLFLIILLSVCITGANSQGISPGGTACVNDQITYYFGRSCVNSSLTWELDGGIFLANNSYRIDNTMTDHFTVKWTNSNVPTGGYKITVTEYCPTATRINNLRIQAQIPNIAAVTTSSLADPTSLAVPCGSTNNITLYAYVNNASGNQAQGDFNSPQSISLPNGWQVISKNFITNIDIQGTHYYYYSIVLKPDATSSGNLYFRNSRSCSSTNQYSDVSIFTVNRSAATYSIAGDNEICNTKTYSINSSVLNNYSWSTSSNLNIINGQNANSVQVQLSQNGQGYIQSSASDLCGNSNIVQTKNVYVGLPNLTSIQANGQTFSGGMCNGQSLQLFAVNEGASSVTWLISSANASSAYLNDYGGGQAQFNSYINDCYGLDINLTNSCGTNHSGTTVCVEDCYYRYSISPNPASDQVTVQFDKTDKAEALPDEIALLSEKSTKAVKAVNVQEMHSKKAFKEGTKIEISVKDLERGVYYLRVTNSRQSADKRIETTRIFIQ